MRKGLSVGIGALAVLLVGIGAVTMAQDVPPDAVPPPDPGLLLNNSLPGWQKQAEPGLPFVDRSAVEATALQAGGDPKATITGDVLTPYDKALEVTRSGNNLSLAADRAVYLVSLSGDFSFRRHPPGVSDRRSTAAYVLIDAITGDVMARGELLP